MATIKDQADQVFRDFVVDGVPSSGNHAPVKSEVRALLGVVDESIDAVAAAALGSRVAVKDKDLTSPPASPVVGDRYIVAASPTGAWAGQAGKIAAWTSAGAWDFFAPSNGYVALVLDELATYAWDSETSSWRRALGGVWTPRGEWSGATAYLAGDFVTLNGASYLALAANTNQSPPTSPSFWILIAAKGDAGAPGTPGAFGFDRIYPTTTAALSNGVAGLTGLVGGSGGTNGTFPLAFSGGGGSDAAGYFIVSGGAVVQAVITFPGYNYTSAPTVSFAASSGLSGASATAVLRQNVPVNGYFSTPGAGTVGATLWRNVSGTATKIDDIPDTAAFDGINNRLLGSVYQSPQLFNSALATIDQRLDPATGNLISLTGSWTTPFIPVVGGQSYSTNYPWVVVWYDSNFSFISGTSSATNVMNAPAAAAWRRDSSRTALGHVLADHMIAQSSSVQPWQPFGGFLESTRLRGSINPRLTPMFARRTRNLFDVGAANVIRNAFMSAAGALTTGSSLYLVSDFIPVTPGTTYSFGFGERGARFVTAFNSSRVAQAGSGSDTQVTTWTCPAGIAEIRISTWIASADAGIVQVVSGATMPPLEPWGYALGDTFLPWLAPLEATEGLARMRHSSLFRSRREASVSDRLSILLIGDSYVQAPDRFAGKLANRLVAAYGDGGGGWTGYGFFANGTPPYVLGGSQPSGINGNARPSSYGLRYRGSWTCTYVSTASPDMARVESSTATAMIERTVPASPTHTALRVVFEGTSNGVVRYRVNGGSWTTQNVQGTVGNIQSFDISLPAGASTTEIEVVSGTVRLCGDIAISTAAGVVVHKCGASGSNVGQYAGVDQTQQVAGWTLLAPDVVVILDGTNSQGSGTFGNYTVWTGHLNTLVDRARLAGPFPDILLVAPPENLLGRINPMQDFSAQMRFVARNKNTAFLDLQQSFGVAAADYGSSSTFPLFNVDNVHPDTNSGGWIMDIEIRRALRL